MTARPLSAAGPEAPAHDLSGRVLLLFLLAVGFIVYGTLWPLEWRPLPPGADLPALLRESLRAAPAGRGDAVANLAFYGPFGLLLGLLLPDRWIWPLRILLTGLCGLLLSSVLETAQLWIVGRVASGADVALNTVGALAGAALAMAAGGRPLAVAGRTMRVVEPVAALLVLAWLGWRLYPYIPSIDLQAWKDNLKPLLLHPAVEPLRTAQLLASWTSAACLADVAFGPRRARLLVPLGLAGALAAEVVIPGKALTLAETLAILLALPAWLLLRGRAWAAPVLAAAMLGAVLAERLAPFDFVGPPRAFGLIPFRSVVGGSLGAGVQAMLAKLFLQGALLWWLVRSGLPLWPAALLQATLVLAASIAQCWLPGRSAEITDTLLVLGLACFLQAFPPRAAAPAAEGARA